MYRYTVCGYEYDETKEGTPFNKIFQECIFW
jgi:hypothetical protein